MSDELGGGACIVWVEKMSYAENDLVPGPNHICLRHFQIQLQPMPLTVRVLDLSRTR